jgi:NitT/TauT family transport system substrate-binding protein
MFGYKSLTSVRRFGLCALLLLMPLTMSFVSRAQELTNVTVRINALAYGSHVGFFTAKRQGFYEQVGLNVEVMPGRGSSNVVALVANKSNDFGYASSAAIIRNVSQDAPVISVATIDATDADAVICHPDANIQEPKDLEGKVVLTAPDAGVNVLFPAMMTAAGADASLVQLTNVAAEAVVPSFLQRVGGAVCLLGGLDDKPAQILAEGGFEPTFIRYNDYIPVTVGYGIITHVDNLTERPEIVAAFVEATLKGYLFALENPEQALEDFLFYNGAEDADTIRPQMEFTLSILTSKNNKEGILGLHVEEDWQATLDVQVTYNDLQTDKTLADFYTNDFVPKTLSLP